MKKTEQRRGANDALAADVALAIVLARARPVPAQPVGLDEAVGRVLAQAVKADRPLPPYDRSAMDGYALRIRECTARDGRLTAVGIAPAGQPFKGSVAKGSCVRIMTGGVVPTGLDAVVPIEQVSVAAEAVTVRGEAVRSLRPWQHIHRCGSDARRGRTLLPAGHQVRPVDVATLAAVGVARPRVARELRVRLLATGSELVAVNRQPLAHQIRESNVSMLTAILRRLPGVAVESAGLGVDRNAPLRARLVKALSSCDLCLTTGGVSAGDFDLVPDLLAELGVRRVFHRLRIKPGKPLYFGVSRHGTLVFGLPGNPVSTLTTFHEFVLPAIRRLMGMPAAAARPERLVLPLAEAIHKKTPLLEFARARLEPGADGRPAAVRAAPHGGSGDFYSLTQSDGLLLLGEEEHAFAAGQPVEFHPWRFF
ncbi:MAG: molybdopterin molybdotransferase MoeA [Planctomycetota bacterium]